MYSKHSHNTMKIKKIKIKNWNVIFYIFLFIHVFFSSSSCYSCCASILVSKFIHHTLDSSLHTYLTSLHTFIMFSLSSILSFIFFCSSLHFLTTNFLPPLYLPVSVLPISSLSHYFHLFLLHLFLSFSPVWCLPSSVPRWGCGRTGVREKINAWRCQGVGGSEGGSWSFIGHFNRPFPC